jgi:hypothetical protein
VIKYTHLSSLFAIVLLILYCENGRPQNQLNGLEWLLGDWISVQGQTITKESWQKVSDHTFEGIGSVQSESARETVNQESLRILEMNGEIFYLAKVGQNPYPVAFKLTEVTDSLAVFQNPEHDFPTEIRYQHTKNDQILVLVSNDNRKFRIIFRRHEPGQNMGE